MSDETKPTIIATCRACGGWVMLAVNDPDASADQKRDVARETAWCIKAGYKISEVTVADVRSGRVKMCECKRDKRKSKQNQPALIVEAQP